MPKLRRDLSRAVTLLEIIERREKINREQLHLSIEVYEKRYQAHDFAGQVLAEFASNATKRHGWFPGRRSSQISRVRVNLLEPVFVAPRGDASGQVVDNHSSSRKEKRQYKKHEIQKDRGGTSTSGSTMVGDGSTAGDPALSSEKEELANLQGATAREEEYAYTVQPRKFSVWN
ncbi:enhancer of polycomb [Culex quinquefasciatus]|uniref:Enhancer of polycomb n=1 Tax=Culex quinquefasciatus TaxID=7176 RepID=B0XHV2_CULQU|nr:enhancer of polycomb [Culex quinquefasciatus]|eukprot:XP_001869224.1 enhancer of polycomb [Culex quinquefasciatus]